MIKTELLEELKAKGQLTQFSKTPAWTKAFDAYNLEKKEKLCPTCTSSFKKVAAWLQS